MLRSIDRLCLLLGAMVGPKNDISLPAQLAKTWPLSHCCGLSIGTNDS